MPAPLARWAKSATPAPWTEGTFWHAFNPAGVASKTSICGRSFTGLSPFAPWTKIPTYERDCDDCLKAYQKLLKHGR